MPALSSRALVTLDQAREYVLNDDEDVSQDAKLISRINAYSAAVWAYTEREWVTSTALTRKFTYRGGNYIDLRPYDLRAATSVVAFTDYPTSSQLTLKAGTTTVTDEYVLRPYGSDPLTSTYRWISFDIGLWTTRFYVASVAVTGLPTFEVSVTGDWGIASVPEDVQEAVLIAIDNAWRNPEGAASRTFGDLTIVEPVDTSGQGDTWRALPSSARALLSPYRDSVEAIVG